MPAPVRVQLLGPLRAFCGPDEATLRGKTARTVLARLSMSPGSVVSVDQLTEALWEDDPPLEPSVSLRSIVSRLRRELGSATIVTAGAGYRLDPSEVSSDLADVEAMTRRLAHEAATPDELADALALWDGEALSDVAWTSAFEPERVRIAELRARLTDAYHDAMLRDGRASEALPDLERAAAAAGRRESTQLLLMRALHECGRTADALRAGNVYRRRMVDETGLDPTEAYDTLVQTLLEDDRLRTSPPAPVAEDVPAAGRGWLPPDTPFVGRGRERAELAAAVRQHRIVTIVGAGGAGKTRLAAEFLKGVDDLPIEVVGLASLPRSAAVDVAVATALGVETSADGARRALVDRLAGQPRMLVLDNCEHVLAGARLLVEHLVRSLADLHVLTTSRTRLGLPDEALVAVGPLDLAAGDSSISAPVELFIDRVARASVSAATTDLDLEVIADICRLVDGLPLALELAAARVPLLGISGLRRRLVEGLAIPAGNVADDDRRQATIESTVGWSLELLGADARRLFDELTVFPAWFDIAAIEAVSTIGDVVGPLSEILDSSLIDVDTTGPAYRLLQPVRHVARRQLPAATRTAIADRYLEWVSGVVDQIDDHWSRDQRFEAQALVIAHRNDLRALLTHLAERGDARRHGHQAKVLARVVVERADGELIEACSADIGPSIDGELARCILAWHRGDAEASIAIGQQAVATIDDSSRLWPLFHWSMAAAHVNRGEALDVARCASIALGHDAGDATLRSESVALWALAELYQDRADAAAKIMAEHEHILRRSTSGGFVTLARGEIAARTDPDSAVALYEQATREALATRSSFTLRLIELVRIALFISLERQAEGLELVCRVIPELLRAGTRPHAWIALRYAATVLGQLDEPDLGLLILDSANREDDAPAVVGRAAEAEAELRANLAEQSSRAGEPDVQPMALAKVWETVEPVLRRHLDAQ